MKKSTAVIGGDQRQVYLAQLLAEDGWKVVTWGLEQGNALSPVPLHEALTRDVLIFPLPVCRGEMLYLPLTDTVLPEEHLWPHLSANQVLLGGMTGRLSSRLQADFGLTMLDYYAREELQVANAVPTAEGAIQLAMEHTKRTIHASRCLVIGCGRIGKVLAQRLHGLGARVTVSARRCSDLAWIDACGWESVRTDLLVGTLGRFDLIFNTVPALVLEEHMLRELREECLLIELASEPGGIDPEAAKCLQRRLIRGPGLPGKVAPMSAAVAIRDSIYHILEERGDIV